MNMNLNFKLSLSGSLKLTSQQQQQQAQQNKRKLNDIYLMQICGNQKKTSVTSKSPAIDFKLACLNSEQTITIYDNQLLKRTHINDAHIDTIINEIDFFKCDANLLLSCGDDSLVKVWDLRNPRKEVLRYDVRQASNDDEANSIKFLSVDIDAADEIIAASTANTDENNSYVYLFDVKMSNKTLKKYSDAHSNDITQVKFDPMNKHRLISASIDGLACVFDLLNLKPDEAKKAAREESTSDNSIDEDDDLIDHVYNTNSSVQKIGYLNTTNAYLYAITFTNELFIWNTSTQDKVYELKLYNSSKLNGNSDYIVDCFNLNSSPNEVVVCLGDKAGNLQFYDLNERLIFNTNTLQKPPNLEFHSDLIRSVHWNYYNSELYTVGEDGILNKWKVGLSDEAAAETPPSTSKSTKRAAADESDDDEGEDEDEEERSSSKKKQKTVSSNKKTNFKKKFYSNNNFKKKY